MRSNLEKFQMAKLRPFQDKIQRQYLSTNVRPYCFCTLQEKKALNMKEKQPKNFAGDPIIVFYTGCISRYLVYIYSDLASASQKMIFKNIFKPKVLILAS